jgi:co-chaperonin GroES (HSP10)
MVMAKRGQEVFATGEKRTVNGIAWELGPGYKADTVKTFTPFGCLLALIAHRPPDTEAGLIMPDGSKGSITTPTAEVIAVGPDVKHVKEGDIVLAYGDTPGRLVQHAGFRYLMLREDVIAGILPRKESRGDKSSSSSASGCGPG